MQTASSELLLNCISAVEPRSVFSRSPQILQHLDDRLHLWIPAPASGDTSLPLPPISQNVPSRVESCLPVILRAIFLSCIYLPVCLSVNTYILINWNYYRLNHEPKLINSKNTCLWPQTGHIYNYLMTE